MGKVEVGARMIMRMEGEKEERRWDGGSLVG
jgi:hypothetical protein